MDNLKKKEVNRCRAPKMSEDEKLCLIELVNEKKAVVESKTTDKISLKAKQLAWEEIEKKFKQKYQCRSAESLHSSWKNLKRLAKQYSSDLKKQTMATGGGKKKVTENSVLEAALSIMNHVTVIGLTNDFDNDAELSVEQLLDDDNDEDYSSDNAVFDYLLKNDQVHDWKKNNPQNLKSSVSEPLKVNRSRIRVTQKPYDNTHQETTSLSPKDQLALILKEQAIEKHNYEIELLKLQIEKETLLIQKIQHHDVGDESEY